MASEEQPTRRFSYRAASYSRFRPGYPPELMGLMAEVGLTAEHVVADVGSGTGLLSELLLANGNRVFAVEPNLEMRLEAEQRLSGNERFVSVAAAAEATGLDDDSIDLIVCGHSFHWFRKQEARREFLRILRPEAEGGLRYVFLLWNYLRRSGTPFLEAHESLVREFKGDFRRSHPENEEHMRDIEEFFGGRHERRSHEQRRRVDLEELQGLVTSISYLPNEGRPGYEEMMERLQQEFDDFNIDGRVELVHDTGVYFGLLRPSSRRPA